MKKWEDLTDQERTPELGYAEALRRIEVVKSTGEEKLDLSTLGLRSIPPEVAGMTSVAQLFLYNNKIADLSPLRGLSKLEFLSLGNNKISDLQLLPELQLTNLDEIWLGVNQITNLEPLSELKSLTKVRVDNNRISDIRPLRELTNLTEIHLDANKISDLEPLRELSGLIELHIGNNPISNLEPLRGLYSLTIFWLSFTQVSKLEPLRKLTSLRQLFVINNPVNDLEPLQGLLDLEILYLSGNQITNLAPLRQLTKLSTLHLKNNQIRELEPLRQLTQIRRLFLGNNPIHSLRPLVHLMKRRVPLLFKKPEASEGIYLEKNPLQDPPLSIAEQGTQVVLDYWAEQDRLGTAKRYEGRLLIIGEGKVGKTSLLKKLQDPDCQLDPDEEQTHGINIWRDWKFPVPDQSEATYTAGVWDFGGQDIQHLTHQYFITPGTAFVLVVNKRSSNATDEETQLDYWFRTVSALAYHPGQRTKILVVHNVFSGDKTAQGVNLSGFQEKYKDRLEISLHRVNLNEDKGGVADLEQSIKQSLLGLPGIGEDIPKGWSDIRKQLGELRNARTRRISFARFAEICGEYNIKEEAGQLLLSRYLFRLGELLHYEEGGSLFDHILLDIDWVTDTVYGITANQQFIDNNGRFGREELIDIWKASGIQQRTDHELMLQLLQLNAFELCWRTEGGDFLAPTLFSAKPPKTDLVNGELGMRFKANYLPKGLLGQVIVRLHDYADGSNYWRNGIYLRREGCRAVLTRPPGSNYLEVSVSGSAPQNYALLDLVRRQIEKVRERSFSRIQFTKEIACPCQRCGKDGWEQWYFSVVLLEKLRGTGDRTANCQNGSTVSIESLLNGSKLTKTTPIMPFIDEIRKLVSNNRLQEAIDLIESRFPSPEISVLSRQFKEVKRKEMMGLLPYSEVSRTNSNIAYNIMTLADELAKSKPEPDRRRAVEDHLSEIKQQLDSIEKTGEDTNKKVMALGQITLHIGQQLEGIHGDLFADRSEQRKFMHKLEETIEQLPPGKQPGEDWYDQPAKTKIKLGLDLLALVPGMSLKWEKELSTDGFQIPTSWSAFKGWFLRN